MAFDRYTLGDDHPTNITFIGKNFAAIDNTIKKMARIIQESARNPKVRNVALGLTSGMVERDQYAEVDNIYHWVLDHTRYVHDTNGMETLVSPLVALDMIEKGYAFQGDCFAGNTDIIVVNKKTGYYEIKNFLELQKIWKNYKALSYSFERKCFEFKDITNFVHKQAKQTYKVKVLGKQPFVCTGTHEFFMNEGQTNKKIVKRQLLDIDLTKSEKRQIFVAHTIPDLGITDNKDLLYLDGMYVAEGSADISHILICQNKKTFVDKIKAVLNKTKTKFTTQRTEQKGGGYFNIHEGAVKTRLRCLEYLSRNKQFTSKHLSMTKDCVKALISGYDDGDGCKCTKNNWLKKYVTMYTTNSITLMKQLVVLHLIMGKALSTFRHKPSGDTVYPYFRLYDYIKVKKEVIPELSTTGIKSIVQDDIQDVYCITVADNHTLTLANGVIASNCDCLTMLTLSLLKSVGYPVKLRIASYNGSNYGHVYGLVAIHGQYIPIDPIKKDVMLGWEAPGALKVKDYDIK